MRVEATSLCHLHPLRLSLACHAAEVRSGDLTAPLQLATGDKVVFTIIEGADGTDNRVGGAALLLPHID